MNIKEVLNSKVLDKNAYEVGTVTDFDIDQKEGTINSMIVSLKKGVFSKEELEVPFEDIETIKNSEKMFEDVEISSSAANGGG